MDCKRKIVTGETHRIEDGGSLDTTSIHADIGLM